MTGPSQEAPSPFDAAAWLARARRLGMRVEYEPGWLHIGLAHASPLAVASLLPQVPDHKAAIIRALKGDAAAAR